MTAVNPDTVGEMVSTPQELFPHLRDGDTAGFIARIVMTGAVCKTVEPTLAYVAPEHRTPERVLAECGHEGEADEFMADVAFASAAVVAGIVSEGLMQLIAPAK